MSLLDRWFNGAKAGASKAATLVPAQSGPSAPGPGQGGTVLRAHRPVDGGVHEQVGDGAGQADDAEDRQTEKLIEGQYRIKRRLGQGSMGTVYLAQHLAWDTEVAVKVPRASLLADEENRHRITREAEAWTDLGMHPNLAYCYYVQPLEQLMLLVVEYVDGGNLQEWIGREGPSAGLKVKLDLAIQFCHGLEHAHSHGMVHRDIKPSNILLTGQGQLKITDFGIVRRGVGAEAKQVAGVGAAADGTLIGIGTEDYMAPEQWDAGPIDARADLFGLGVCLYEMLCGRRPYAKAVGPRQPAPDPARLAGGEALPAELSELMKRCVDWEPDKRPDSAKQVRQALCAIYQDRLGRGSIFTDLPGVSKTADSLNNRAISYLALQKDREARSAWQEALSVDPLHLESNFNLGMYRWRCGESTDLPLVRQLESVRAAVGGWRCDHLLGLVHIERREWEVAQTLLRAAAAAAPPRDQIEIQTALHRASESYEDEQRAGAYLCDGLKDKVDFAAFSSGAGRAISKQPGKPLRAWNLDQGTCIGDVAVGAENPSAIFMTRDGKHFLLKIGTSLSLWLTETVSRVKQYPPLPIKEDDRGGEGTALAMSPDGRLVVAVKKIEWKERNRLGTRVRLDTLFIWDLTGGRWIGEFQAHEGTVTALGFSPDCRFVASAGMDKVIRVWSWSLEQPGSVRKSTEIVGLANPISSLTYSPDGRYIASGDFVGRVRIWDAGSGECIRQLEGHSRSRVEAVDFSSDGRFIVSNGGLSELRLWDVAAGRCLRTFEGVSGFCSWSNYASGTSASVSPDDRWVWARRIGGSRLFRLGGAWDGQQGYVLSRPDSLQHILEANARRAQLVGSFEQALGSALLQQALDAIAGLEGLPGGRRSPETVTLRSRLTARCRRSGVRAVWLTKTHARASDENSYTADLAKDGKYFLTGGGRTLRIRDLSTGACLRSWESPESAENVVGKLAPNGKQFLARWAVSDHSTGLNKLLAAKKGVLVLGDLAAGTHHQLGLEWRVGSSMCFSPDGRLAATGAHDGKVYLWNLGADPPWAERASAEHQSQMRQQDAIVKVLAPLPPACLRILTCYESHVGVSWVAFLPDGQRLATAAPGHPIKVWDVVRGRSLHEIHSTSVENFGPPVAMSPDGRFVWLSDQIMGSAFFYQFDLSTGAILRRFENQHGKAWRVAISQDGRFGFSGHADGAIQIFDFDAGKVCFSMHHQESIIDWLAVCADPSVLVTASGRSIHVWHVDWDLQPEPA